MNSIASSQNDSMMLDLYYRDGSVRSTLNFGKLGIHDSLALAFRNAFASEFGHTSEKSQRSTWTHLRKFCQFLREGGSSGVIPLSASVLVDYHQWLVESVLAPSSARTAFSVAVAHIGYCERNYPLILSRRTKFNVEGFAVSTENHRTTLTDSQIKTILVCCQNDMEQVENRLAVGRAIREGGANQSDDCAKSKIIAELFDLGQGRLPSAEAVVKAKNNLKRRVWAVGGLRKITRQVWLCTDDLIPFYIAMLIQTSGNATSIRDLERDCVRPHPIRDDLERIVWQKLRAHKEQWLDIPVGRGSSAANIARRLRRLNEDLVPHCLPRHKDKLFVAYRIDECVPGVPSVSSFNVLREEFVKRHDLPRFTFSSIRRAGARAHYDVTNSIQAAQARLNHVSIRTTSRYLDMEKVVDAHDRVIHRYQGLLLQASLGSERSEDSNLDEHRATSADARAETVFGFECKDPFAGLAEGSKAGSLCMQFQKCATCPGAVIPLDDVVIVARLLAASSALEDARERATQEGWIARYEKLYEATRQILNNQILPAVGESVRTHALAKVDSRRIPRLE
ncbi:hypothetical protein PQR75_01675 [Paraburkholderia fungorum]|uniref:hypothetical protein n=1 Tax=Paraburkholderia fungorum TaxID=134537 RepID=UPI0038BB0148